MIPNNENDLRISDLIKELRKVKREHGDLRVSTYRSNGEVGVMDKRFSYRNPRYLTVLTGRRYKNSYSESWHKDEEIDKSEKFYNI